METGIELIAQERTKQIEKHGYNLGHDKKWDAGQLVNAAEAYLDPMRGNTNEYGVLIPAAWPFEDEYWKGEDDDRVTQLAKAGAFIAAEIDRLQSL